MSTTDENSKMRDDLGKALAANKNTAAHQLRNADLELKKAFDKLLKGKQE